MEKGGVGGDLMAEDKDRKVLQQEADHKIRLHNPIVLSETEGCWKKAALFNGNHLSYLFHYSELTVPISGSASILVNLATYGT